MTTGEYNPYFAVKDYTFTGQIRPMKLVFFDLQARYDARLDASRYSEPLAFSAALMRSRRGTCSRETSTTTTRS